MTVHESSQVRLQRRLPVGAEALPNNGGVHFRVWAPKHRQIDVVFEDGLDAAPLDNEGDGYFSGVAPEARAGGRYKFRLDGGAPFPDPVSRFQPDGVHGPSQVVDPSAFKWTDQTWPGVDAAGQVLYEIHIGTFTREGNWQSAMRELASLKDLGVTCLEVMPVNEFAGRWGWGYDGVQLFAPYHHYGSADDFRKFVDRCHAIGLGVILDVVYNHLGPDGNYLGQFSDDYFSRSHNTDWGDAINFDGENCAAVREFFLSNVRYWLEEFHLDGFRFDATQAIIDTKSPKHILAEITETALDAAAADGRRSTSSTKRAAGDASRPPIEPAGTACTRCGTTTFITARWRR
jgi:maltooligosyltrehalose trehalohydrolase